MFDNVKRSIRCALAGVSALGALAGGASAQEAGKALDIHNVLLTFHLVQADGFTGEDPEISEVVGELRKLFNFQGYRLLSTSVFNVGLVPRSSVDYLAGEGSQRIFPDDSKTPLTIKAEVVSQRSMGTLRAKVTLTDQTTRIVGNVARSERLPLLEASVTIRDGQRVVLGSARRTASEPVLILVVTPRVDP